MSSGGFGPGSYGRSAVRAAVLLVVIAGGITAARWLLAGTPATGDARWIWAPRDKPSNTAPVAFYVYRDFDLAQRPARARLLIQAEEEYVVWLNGRPVGGGRFRLGSPLGVYPVEDLLLAGGNRLLVELRSSGGGGGLLASLQEAAPQGAFDDLVVSDGRWRLTRRWEAGLGGGWSSPGSAEAVVVWGLPPIGRWGVPELGPPRPLLASLGRPPGTLPQRPAVVSGDRGAAGLEVAWADEVVGYLALELAPESSRLGLVKDSEDRLVSVVVADGAESWLDAEPRRWSRARISGLDGVRAVSVAELPPEAVTHLLPRDTTPTAGLFGIRPPPLRTPLMQLVRREVQAAE